MLIIPAIDIQDGCVVRFVQGRFNKKIYSRYPLRTAKHWVSQGAKLIHLVDLDGALYGKIKNLDVVRELVKNVNVPVQFSGGVREIDTIKMLLGLGLYRVSLGTKAIEDEGFLKKAFRLFKDKIIVSCDAKSNNILIKGWRVSSKGKNILDFIRGLKTMGFKEFIYTDISKDGTLQGPNIKEIKLLLKETGMKLIASGGISNLDDISRLKLLENKGLCGIIIGKALYEGRFTLRQALKLA